MDSFKNNWTLISISFTALFLELLTIRLISTEIRIFAYLSNLVLLASFVGLGIGMIIKKKLSIVLSSLLLFFLLVIVSANYIVRWTNLEFKIFSGITELLAPLSESYIWFQIDTYSKTGIVIGLIFTVFIFSLIAASFTPIGQVLGNSLKKHKSPIFAYSINIISSIAGMWAFQAFTLARFTPYFGLIIVLGLLVLFAKSRLEKYTLIIIFAISISYIVPKVESQNIIYWSPYQKLSLSPILKSIANNNPQPEGWYLEVNNVGYMSLLDLSDKYQASAEAQINELYNRKQEIDFRYGDHYALPFKFKPKARKVLIVGAGAGNDAAAALRNIESRIDVVEIDPTIVEIGKKFHPEKPYQNSNINIFVEDGRTFFQRSKDKYDLVIMGLADSHTLSSSMTNLRLDHYLYTQESLKEIKKLLKDDGILFLTFEVTRDWIGSRLENGLRDVFDQEPLVFEVRSKGVFGWGGVAFVVSKNPQIVNNILLHEDNLATFIHENHKSYSSNLKSLTDNWPYLYLDKPRIPIIHLLIAVVFLIGGFFLLRVKNFGKNSIDWSMFALGAAFLLFEFQNVSKTGLIFGLTWVTNLFTISAILILLLLANFAVYKKLISPKSAFIYLIVTLIIQLLIPLRIFNSWPYLAKISLASLFLNLPVFFGGVIFTNILVRSRNKAKAFGSNFLGSVFGVLAEMVTFLTGLHFLLYLIIILYLIGFNLSRFSFLPRFNKLK